MAASNGQSADVVIVGGAVMGSSTAYFLRRLGYGGRIVVIEKDPSYAEAATGRSVASIRQQYSTPENIRISQFGIEFFRGIRAEFGPEADIAFRERGYLMMASPDGLAVLRQNIALQLSLGADTELLAPAEIARRWPWLNVEGVAGAGWGRSGEGWVDPHALLSLFRAGARARGVTYLHDEVVGLDVEGGRITGALLKSGDRIGCGVLVNAAGWHTHKVAAMAGIEVPVRPKKRMVFVVDIRTELPGCGLMIDATGFYFRPEGRFYLTGMAPPESADPDTEDFDIDHALFETEIWPRLATRAPAFEALKVVNAWSCHYDYNLLDQNAILGPHDEIANHYFICGFSGHGLQQGPGVGRATAEHIMTGRWQSIDLSALGYARVREGRPLRELNVI